MGWAVGWAERGGNFRGENNLGNCVDIIGNHGNTHISI